MEIVTKKPQRLQDKILHGMGPSATVVIVTSDFQEKGPAGLQDGPQTRVAGRLVAIAECCNHAAHKASHAVSGTDDAALAMDSVFGRASRSWGSLPRVVRDDTCEEAALLRRAGDVDRGANRADVGLPRYPMRPIQHNGRGCGTAPRTPGTGASACARADDTRLATGPENDGDQPPTTPAEPKAYPDDFVPLSGHTGVEPLRRCT